MTSIQAESLDLLTASDRPDTLWPAVILAAVLGTLLVGALILHRVRRPEAWCRPVGEPAVPPDHREHWWLLGILVVAAAIRLFRLGSLAGIEAEWGSVESLPWLDVLFHGRETRTDPPLLYLLQHLIYPFSRDPGVYRLPVAAFGVGLVWATYRAGRRILGREAALVAAGLLALHPAAVAWSQTVRAYSPAALLLMLGLPHALALARWATARDALIFGITASLAIWTHYVSLVFLLSVFVVIALSRYRDVRSLAILAATGFGIAIAVLPLAPFFFADLGSKQGFDFATGYPLTLMAFLTGWPFGLGLILLVALIASRPWRRDGTRFIAGVLAGVLVLQASTSRLMHWEPLFSVQLVPLFVLLLAALLVRQARVRPRLARAMAALVAVGYLAMTACFHAMPTDDPRLWGAVRPYLWRGVSYPLFAAAITEAELGDAGQGCGRLLTFPRLVAETLPYHLGPMTMEEAGGEPFTEPNVTSLVVPLRSDGREVLLEVAGTTEWRSDSACFWYISMFQRCRPGQSLRFEADDCERLPGDCEPVLSMADGDLYRCPSMEER